MPQQTKTTNLGWPVYSLSFLPSGDMLVGGGGGPTATGVKNSVGLYKVDPKSNISEVSQHVFSNQEDGCMSLCVHPKDKAFIAGVNCSKEDVDDDRNLNARIFLIQKSKYVYWSWAVKSQYQS
jgi:prolactin regulatory element-binding protein